MKTRLAILSVLVLVVIGTVATADPFPTYSPTFGSGTAGEKSLQTILDDVTTDPEDGSTVNVLTDALLDSYDSYWQTTATGGSYATFIIEIAGEAANNTFGLFNPTDLAEKAVIFDGAATAGSKRLVEFLEGGKVYVGGVDTGVELSSNLFGFYMARPGVTFYSDSSLNPDGTDQMLAYQGKGDDVLLPGSAFAGAWTPQEFVLAWEDLKFIPDVTGDGDYNDLVLMIESVRPVPVPGAVLLGLLGLSAAGIRLRKYA